MKNGTKIAVGMSGGVDSSVSAYLLKKSGYDVVGLFMKLWHDPCGTGENACCDEKALADARAVAKKIGIPLYVVDTRQEFKEAVTDYFIDEYKNARTPNPCVVCNKKIKFGRLLDFAKKIGCDYLATGHYSRVVDDLGISNFQLPISNQFSNSNAQNLNIENFDLNKNLKLKIINYHLLKGVDDSKDQSYFLYQLDQKQLVHIIFPVGEMTKTEVRRIAREAGVPVHEKKESQEICFVEDNYRDFLSRNLSKDAFKDGDIVDRGDNVIGRHNGLINYTIGQRKGIEQNCHSCPESRFGVNSSRNLKIPGQARDDNRKPLYVTGFDLEKNQLIVGEEEELYKSEFTIRDMHWTNQNYESRIMNDGSKDLRVKIRYKSEEVPCTIKPLIHNSVFSIHTSAPVRALTPGQSAVFYYGDEVIGGGIIR